MKQLAKIALTPPIEVTFQGFDLLMTGISLDAFLLERCPSEMPIKGQIKITNPSELCKVITVEQISSNEGFREFKPVGLDAKTQTEDLLNIIRKNQHIEICQNQDVESSDHKTGFELFQFEPVALPNLNWNELNTEQTYLSRLFSAPILITGMTGGIRNGEEINRRLAVAASHFNIPMGVGSQRIALENPEHAGIFQLKKYASNLFLIANLGMSQLRKGKEVEDCQKAIEMIDANAIAIHINVLQELIQEEGQRDFRGIIDRIKTLVDGISVPVIIKEVGAGIDIKTARTLKKIGVKNIDIGGKGGTSWAHIEGLRSKDSITQTVGKTFRNWGIPTAESLAMINNDDQLDFEISATGGIRDGISIAKSLALGAKMAGIGLPLFRAALTSEKAPIEVIETLLKELKTTMLCTESKVLADLMFHIKTNNQKLKEINSLSFK